jgi:hypothetical protein
MHFEHLATAFQGTRPGVPWPPTCTGWLATMCGRFSMKLFIPLMFVLGVLIGVGVSAM